MSSAVSSQSISVIYFDDSCPMCNKYVQFLDSLIKPGISIFLVPSTLLIDSRIDSQLLSSLGISPPSNINSLTAKTIVYCRGSSLYLYAVAIQQIMWDSQSLPLQLASAFLAVIPNFIKNWIYVQIASRRIKISRLFPPATCVFKFNKLNLVR